MDLAARQREGYGPAPPALLYDVYAIAALFIWIFARWWRYLGSRTPLVDEYIYLEAFRAAAAGHSPYEVSGYYYPSAFATLGAWILRLSSDSVVNGLLRASAVLGLAIAVWVSLSLWPASRMRRWVAAAAYLGLAPAVRLGQQTGNISFAVIGAILIGLVSWRQLPLPAGLLLGGSVAVKPLAPLSILTLFFHRPRAGGRRHLIAGSVGAVTSAALLLPWSRFLEMSAQTIDRLPYIRSISLHRVLTLMGLEASPLWIAILVAGGVIAICRTRSLGPDELVCLAGTAAVLATPIIWPHTLLLTLPVQVAALVRALARRSTPAGLEPSGGSRMRRYELSLVILAVAALQLSEGAGAVDDRAVPFQIVALGVPLLAAPLLTAYLLLSAPSSALRPLREPRRRLATIDS